MERIPCERLLNMKTISSAFTDNNSHISDQLITCFYSCYQSQFIKWAKITYQHYPPDMIEFLSINSFTDGVLKFKEAARRNELYQSSASVKTVLFHFCKNILLGNLKNENRLSEKNKKLELHLSDKAWYYNIETAFEMKERKHNNIMKALAKMSVADRQIIQWRHIEEKSNDEIAALLAITVASATNRIYRCMERLRKLVEDDDRQ